MREEFSILEGGYNIEGNSKELSRRGNFKKFNLMFIILNFIDKKVFGSNMSNKTRSY